MVAVKGDNLSILEAENIGRGNIDHLARGSDSLGTNGQLTVMRSPNSMLDDHDVTRDVNARYLTADIWKSTCKGGNRVANGLSAKLRARSHIPHVTFLREKGDKLLGIQSRPLTGSIEFFDDFFIAGGVPGYLGGLRHSLRVDILPDALQLAILDGNGEDPVVLERLICRQHFPRREADDQNPVSLRDELKGRRV
jgi:hypothetical protein